MSSAEAPAVRQFHDEVELSLKFVERVDVDDVRVVQSRAGAGLAIKTLQHFRIFGQIFPHEFHRHLAFEHQVKRAIHRAHAARGDRIPQLELPESHRHHHWMAALGAGRGGERRQVAGNENLGAAATTSHHAQGFADFIRCWRHSLTLAFNVPTTSLDIAQRHWVQNFPCCKPRKNGGEFREF